ncbi:MAG: DUF3575 domain-containing protein [Bacteroidales bacterium]|nr:DUF3575 domain-containing protein [Bacteroidales bacterium]
MIKNTYTAKRIFVVVVAVLMTVCSGVVPAKSPDRVPSKYDGKWLVRGTDTLRTRQSADTVLVYVRDSLYQGYPEDSTGYRGVALRTNLFYAGSATPNLGIEIPVGKHFTLGANAGVKPWPRWLLSDWDRENPKKWRHLLIAPEARFWFKNVYDGLFIGTDLVYTHYNVGSVKFPLGLYPYVRDHRLQGDFYGLGLFVGYSWWLSDHLRLELEAGAAAGYNSATVYDCAYCGAEIGKERGPVIVPKLGLNLSYNFTRRKKLKELVEIIQRPVDTLVRPRAVMPPSVFVPVLPIVADWKGVAGMMEKDHPVLCPSSEYRPYTPDRILRKEEEPLMVFFELDKVRLLREFSEDDYHRDNGPVLDEIMDITEKIMADTTSTVTRIQIVGLASVEGRLAHNVWLGNTRAMALQKYIQERLDIPDSMFDTVGGGEAWSEFRDQINDIYLEGGGAGLTKDQLEWVLSVIDNEPDVNKREAKLKAAEGGKIYEKLLTNILHDQRNSGYLKIYYDYVPDESAREINAAIDMLRKGEYAKALEMLEKKRDDRRSDNAYAVALFYNGREAEALQMLKAAAANGDESAERNLMQLTQIAQQRADYEQYKSEMERYESISGE